MLAEPKYVSDQQLLDWILDGSIVITSLRSERPVLNFKGRTIKPQLVEQSGRYRVGEQCARWSWQFSNGSTIVRKKVVRVRRRVVCAKLVWMFANKTLIPESSQIHHGKKGRLYDGIGNLECLTNDEHSLLHYGSLEIPA